MKSSIKNNILRLFWITLTAGICIFTIYNSVRTIGDMRRTKEQSRVLDTEIEKYRAKIEADSTFIENMKSSHDFMESYAREHLHLQRDGETVYHL